MASKSSKKRRRAQKQAAQAQAAPRTMQVAGAGSIATHAPDAQRDDSKEAKRPTDERMARGNWRLPQGMGKNEQPVIDTSSDIIGQLHDAGRITSGQEQAARHWQALRAAYIAELPDVAGFKSCIAGSVPGFDDGDGDAAVIYEYRRMESRLTRSQRLEVLHVCEDGYRPRDIAVLRSALGAIGGC